MWGISYISDAGDKSIVKIMESGACQTIVDLLQHKHTNIVLPAIRALGNFVTGEDTETQSVLDCGVLPSLQILLEHDDTAIKKEACWTLSNVCAGTPTQVAQVIEIGIFDKLISLVYEGKYEIQRESGWCISNSTALKVPEIIEKIVEKNGLEAMCHILSLKNDAKTLTVLLEGVRNILEVGELAKANGNIAENPFVLRVEECEGLDVIEDLQQHQNQHVYELAINILEMYFQIEDIDFSLQPDEDVKLEF